MAGVAVPDEARLPAGPQRDLTVAIHELYVAAGKPGTRKVSNAIRERDDLPDTVSHEAVRAILGGARSRWHKVESVVRQLAVWSVELPDIAATVEKIHQLWLAADNVQLAQPRVALAADPVVFRQAVRGLHGVAFSDAISTLLRMVLYVPRTHDKAFVVAVTASEGRWICAFTGIDRLQSFQRVVRPRWSGDGMQIVGRELIRQVSELRVPVGIVVDPVAAPVQAAPETLPLQAHLVVEIAKTL